MLDKFAVREIAPGLPPTVIQGLLNEALGIGAAFRFVG